MQTYCVLRRPQDSLNCLHPRTKRYYLKAESASQAIIVANEERGWLVLGVEPGVMSAFPPQREGPSLAKTSIVA